MNQARKTADFLKEQIEKKIVVTKKRGGHGVSSFVRIEG